MAANDDILDRTGNGAKFCIKNFRKMINDYIKENENKCFSLKDEKGKDSRKMMCVMSIPGFCCENDIDCEEDFWRLMQHENREYCRLGKKLITHIKNLALILLVNDKNTSFSQLIGKTYFPDDDGGKILESVPENIKNNEKDIDLEKISGNISNKEDKKELLRLLRKSIKN